MKKKNIWRPMSILVEHDMNMERLSREWKESQSSFSFWETTEALLMVWVKFAFCTGSRIKKFCREMNRRKRLAMIKTK